MRYLLIIFVALAGCAGTQTTASLEAEQRAQERYEATVRSCAQQGKPVYVRRTGSKIRKRLDRWEMLSAKCADL